MGYTEEQVQEQAPVEVTTPAVREFRQPTREEREELKALSKEVFGASSKWQKLQEYDQVITKKVKEIVPGENGAPDTEKEVEVPVLAGKSKQSVRKYRTIPEVLQLLREFKAKREAFLAEMKKAQEERAEKAKAAALAKKVQDDLGGSALT